MLFVNMLYDSADTSYARDNGTKLVVENVEMGVPVTVDFSQESNCLTVCGGDGHHVFCEGLKPEDGNMEEKYMGGLSGSPTYREVAETADNPIIIVLCNEIGLYANVPANVKFIHISNNYEYEGKKGLILAALIYGACEFNGVALERCNPKDINDKEVVKTLTAEDLSRMETLVDSLTGYKFYEDVISQAQFSYKQDRKGFCTYSCQFIKRDMVWLDRRGLDEATRREKARLEKVRIAEEQRKAKIQKELEKSERERKLREEEKAYEREMEAKRKEERKLSRRISNKQDTVTKSVGADAFLKAVMAMKEQQ